MGGFYDIFIIIMLRLNLEEKLATTVNKLFFYRVVRTEGVFCRIHRRDGGYSGITR